MFWWREINQMHHFWQYPYNFITFLVEDQPIASWRCSSQSNHTQIHTLLSTWVRHLGNLIGFWYKNRQHSGSSVFDPEEQIVIRYPLVTPKKHLLCCGLFGKGQKSIWEKNEQFYFYSSMWNSWAHDIYMSWRFILE